MTRKYKPPTLRIQGVMPAGGSGGLGGLVLTFFCVGQSPPLPGPSRNALPWAHLDGRTSKSDTKALRCEDE